MRGLRMGDGFRDKGEEKPEILYLVLREDSNR